ncbi:hypothetical protein K438DRAFT_1826903 [Mycena galopus ATCC 62051]|nr:hypothetical protein K438DRAFT_1826903 [Mycena galopus ATCC 62051]
MCGPTTVFPDVATPTPAKCKPNCPPHGAFQSHPNPNVTLLAPLPVAPSSHLIQPPSLILKPLPSCSTRLAIINSRPLLLISPAFSVPNTPDARVPTSQRYPD